MTTAFFDLPREVRALVWRRARFLTAKDRVAAALVSRALRRPEFTRQLYKRHLYNWHHLAVAFDIGATKQMIYEHMHDAHPECDDIISNSVRDYARLRASVRVFDDGVKLFLDVPVVKTHWTYIPVRGAARHTEWT